LSGTPKNTTSVLVETAEDAPVRETQVHIVVGCADARDVGQVHIDAIHQVRQRYRTNGIHVQYLVLRVPGAFVSNDVLTDIRTIVSRTEQQYYTVGQPLRYFVHIQAHGALDKDLGGYFCDTTTSLPVTPGSPLNCGMLGATGVAAEMERLILERKPTVSLTNGSSLTLDHEDRIRTLLGDVYGYDGYFAGDWVRSIDDLRTHARAQKATLERAVTSDPELRRVHLTVTAGIQDYAHHRQVRLDCGQVEATFWDEVHDFMHARADEQGDRDPDIIAQAQKQTPDAGLFAMDESIKTVRPLAVRWYAHRKGLANDDYQANRLFALGGSSFDKPRTPFGPYAIAGFYYAAKHLNLSDWIVTGRDEAQTDRMVAKIHADPLLAFFLQELNVSLLPVTAEVLMAQGS
jgi:hypothetical protein